MTVPDSHRRRLRILITSLLGLVPPSIAFTLLLGGGTGGDYSIFGMLVASVGTLLLIATPIIVFELWVLDGVGPIPRLKALPLAPFLAIRLSGWSVIILLASLLANRTVWATPLERPLVSADFWWTVGFSFLAAVAVQTISLLNGLLGRGVLKDLMVGRYHRPRVEERLVCFIDLKGSTGLANTLGPVTFLRLLSRFATVAGEETERAGGRVHAYAGDAIIVTWAGSHLRKLDGAPAAIAALRDRLAAEAPAWHAGFGTVPAFRAALHLGPVAAGEMGEEKRAIVLLGDTMNVTARLETAAKAAAVDVIVSGPLHERLSPAWQARLTPLGPLTLRGRDDPMEAYALTDGVHSASSAGTT